MAADAAAPSASTLRPAELRKNRGKAIAALCRITRKGDHWLVPSQSGGGFYRVNPEPASEGVPLCTCRDYETRQQPCKHVFAVELIIRRESHGGKLPARTPTAETLVKNAKSPRKTYKQDWPAYNAAQANEKPKFQTLLADLCRGIREPAPDSRGGRPPVPLADRVFAVAFKVYVGMSSRRFSGDLQTAHERGHLSRLPHYNSVLRFLEDPAMTPMLRALIVESSLPLKSIETKFAVDSSGFSTSRFVRWFDHKYGRPAAEYDWVKCHLITGVKTNIVTAVEIGERHSGDSPHFGPLVNQTARRFTIGEVSADAAYLSKENMETVIGHGGTPFILFKSNTTGGVGGIFGKMFHCYQFNRDEYLAHYHKRSNVETTFSMIKGKFGDSLRSKTDTAMENEALAKVLAHNLCCLIQSTYELGVNVTFWGEDEPKSIESPGAADDIEALAWL